MKCYVLIQSCSIPNCWQGDCVCDTEVLYGGCNDDWTPGEAECSFNLGQETGAREFQSYDIYRNGEYLDNVSRDINDYIDENMFEIHFGE